MIRILLHNLHKGSSKAYELERMYDFDKLVADFGPVINSIIQGTNNVRVAADKVAEYLSNHHLQAEIIDPADTEEIYDPNVEHYEKEDKKPEKAIDLKDVLETYNEIDHVDIPEFHVLNSATHRWNK